jgi:long-chain acyl-CoA synthetase
VTHILREQANNKPAEVALTDGDTSYSWGELADVCEQAVQALASLHLAAGQRVAVIARNAAPTAVVYLMARFSGVQIVAASFHLTAKEMAYILNDANVGAVFCDESTRANVVAAAREVGIAHVFTIDGDASSDGAQAFLPWVNEFNAVEPDLSVTAAPNVLYTSGTTGFPKGVMNPQLLTCSVRKHVDDYREPADIGTYLMMGPMYHAGPLGALRRLTGGRPMYVLKQFSPEGVLQVIQDHGITGTTMVPTHFAKLLELPADVRERYNLSSLKFLDHTGSSCPVAVKEAMINWVGPILVDRYGGTEAGTVCTITSPEWLQHKGSAGKCLPRFTAHVVDDNDVEVPVGQVGRLYFIDHSGEGVKYMNAPEKTAAAHIRPGVFTLGDLGYVNEEGYVFVTGRTADTVVSGGVNLYPAEIERVLFDCALVRDAAVIGVADEVMGEVLFAYVVPHDAGASEDELIAGITAHCREVMAGPKVPRRFAFINELPRNAMGKLDRKVLRENHK